jgi:hypothetical protein
MDVLKVRLVNKILYHIIFNLEFDETLKYSKVLVPFFFCDNYICSYRNYNVDFILSSGYFIQILHKFKVNCHSYTLVQCNEI